MIGPARFSLESYGFPAADGTALEVTALSAEDAQRLGHAFAAIDPWATYGYPASVLANFLASAEPGAPRFALMRRWSS